MKEGFKWEMRGAVPITRAKEIRPCWPPEDRELAGINPARCVHEWAGPDADGLYWCQICLITGEV